MNGRAYRDDHVYEDDDEPSDGGGSTPACPVCGRVTTVEHVGTPRLEWWCGDCNVAFPDEGLGPVSAAWATTVRDQINETREKKRRRAS